MKKNKGSLIVMGSGIRAVGHITIEGKGAIENAEKVFYVVADPLTSRWIESLNPNSEDLYNLYSDNKLRIQTYDEMTQQVVKAVRTGLRVCFVFYGHPGIFVNPSHRAISILRREGYSAEMLPGISSIDSMFADLGVDPSRTGTLMYDATNFLVRNRQLDTTCCVVIWQVACVGDSGFNSKGYDCRHLPVLVDRLEEIYGSEHEVVLYEASQYPICAPRIDIITCSGLREARITGITTLFIPPKDDPPVNTDLIKQFGIGRLEKQTS